MKCLWIAREIPFPADSGDRIYTAQLSQSFAHANGDLTFIGIADQHTRPAPAGAGMQWKSVGGGRYGTARSLLSTMPLVAAMHATGRYRAELSALYAQHWDAIVFDHYASGWALREFMQKKPSLRPRLAYIAHNHEEKVLRAVAAESDAGLIKRAGFWQNYLKVKSMERYMVETVDVVTAITAEDAAGFTAQSPGVKTLVLTPGYNGKVSESRRIDAAGPRHVIMVGSFRWAAKQENLRQFLRIADRAFADAGIVFDVVGDMPAALRKELEPGLKATVLHGFVDDPSPIYERARIALVPEAIGGGFKLKFLDYVFQRLPVATLADAVAGLPAQLRAQMIQSPDHAALAQAVVRGIDDVAALERMQNAAFDAARSLFRWSDRGQALLAALAQ
ncbi:glycosyltransferase [Herbaspirillum sp.]|uniref:glycosyltransferase n=1 Tax=Herbaspirillum sp. TaxID=1890675 RepID=UPI001B004D9D|nr:glycosyltransferase [Herbaspirillum sp.]MBO9535885.1 glycosyltransferase [Herbaspirillum sp.]